MTSTEERRSGSRRWLGWLIALLAVLFALYSAGWYYLAGRVDQEVARAVTRLQGRGINAECSNLAVSGYPLGLDISCDSVAYEDDARNVAASLGGMVASSRIYRPLVTTADLQGPLRTTAPATGPIWLDWDSLQASIGLSWPTPSRIGLRGQGLSAQTDPDDADPVQLFSAGAADAELRPSGADFDYAGHFSDLEIDPGVIGQRNLPPLDGSGDATVRNGMLLLTGKDRSLRGLSADIRNLDLSSGDARVILSGPLSVDAGGLIDADLTLKIVNPQAVAAVLSAVVPERESQIKQGFAALVLLGREPSMPLKIVKGKASLGFIPLGNIKPVR